MTPKARQALQWFADPAEKGWFVSKRVASELLAAGMIEVIECATTCFGTTTYQLTDAGRKALE